MAFYTNNIKSWCIDAQFDRSKMRSEFRLDNNMGALYLSNMRLINVGLVVDTQANRYNLLLGSEGVIKNMYLYDGKVVLDSVLNFSGIEAFKRYNKTNSSNCDIHKVLKNHGLGFVLSSYVVEDMDVPIVTEFFPNAPNTPATSEENSPLGFLNLKEIFPLLGQLEYIPTSLFKDLKLVIEYELGHALTSVGASVPTKTTLPLLIADQVMDDALAVKVASEFKQVVWNAVEVESVYLPEGTAGKVQSVNFKLSGFNNKTLGRLLMQKAATTLQSALYRNVASEAMVEEAIQVVVNGSNVLPEFGADRPNMRLSLLSSTFGNCNSIPSSNDTAFYGVDMVIDDAADRVGHLDYFGLLISDKIQNLQVQYSRNCRTGGSAQYKQPLNLNFYGEVAKTIAKTNDGYRILYL